MDASRLERAARALLDAWERDCDSPGPASWVALEAAFTDLRAALAAQPAQEPVDTLCLFCRTELDPDEMDDGSDLPPLAPGVCSECFQRWHDEPVWRKRLKEATDKPAQAGAPGHTDLMVAPESVGPFLDANPAPAQAGEALPTSLLPVARALLRDADTALENTGGMRVWPSKATVDASRLRHVVAAVVAHLEAQRNGGAS